MARRARPLRRTSHALAQESGYAPYPVWSTADGPAQDGSGDPDGHFFVPAEADTPVAANDGGCAKKS